MDIKFIDNSDCFDDFIYLTTDGSDPEIQLYKYEWLDSSRYSSNTFPTTDHPAYLKILSYGDLIIPLLLNDMREHQTHWFFALNDLTGINPVRPENRGNIDRMINDWLAWGAQAGYL